jgi:hypothetical protein
MLPVRRFVARLGSVFAALKAQLHMEVSGHYTPPTLAADSEKIAQDFAAAVKAEREIAASEGPSDRLSAEATDQGAGEKAAIGAWLQTQNVTKISRRALEQTDWATVQKMTLTDHEFEHCKAVTENKSFCMHTCLTCCAMRTAQVLEDMTFRLANETSATQLLVDLASACERELNIDCAQKGLETAASFKNMTRKCATVTDQSALAALTHLG